MVIGRTVRNIKSLIEYPFWMLTEKKAPDNHIFKKRRVLKIAREKKCQTFIETGTFYGQMLSFASKHFDLAMSVELFEPFYKINLEDFKNNKKVQVFLGDSSSKLNEMIKKSEGKILFWLDGHYSGQGTACGTKVSPILDELEIIKNSDRKDNCILIDDARLFTGLDGYPTIEEARNKLLSINKNYKIYIDHDCIVSVID